MLNIYETTNYSQFYFFDTNRPIQPDKLISSIKNKNMLSTHPIIVTTINNKLYVVDGQNRLTAAKELKTPIYYVIDNSLKESDIYICQLQKNWSLENYLHYYRNKITDYELIALMIERSKLNIYLILKLCNRERSMYEKFRNGTFRITRDISNIETTLDYLLELQDTLIPIIGKDRFVKVNCKEAILQLIERKNYSQKEFIRKIKLDPK